MDANARQIVLDRIFDDPYGFGVSLAGEPAAMADPPAALDSA